MQLLRCATTVALPGRIYALTIYHDAAYTYLRLRHHVVRGVFRVQSFTILLLNGVPISLSNV